MKVINAGHCPLAEWRLTIAACIAYSEWRPDATKFLSETRATAAAHAGRLRCRLSIPMSLTLRKQASSMSKKDRNQPRSTSLSAKRLRVIQLPVELSMETAAYP